jgi:orotate phosphoribosyltransferase
MAQRRFEKLREIILKKSYREGDFTLASGKKSSFYIDLKATTLSAEGAYLIGKAVMELHSQDTALKDLGIQAVGGMTLGADPLATAVSLASHARGLSWPAFIVRKTPKDHGTSRFIEGTENLSAGARVLVLEDVVTTGGSSLQAIERLREAGYVPVAVLTVVDRQQGGQEAFERAGVRLFSLLTLSELRG